MSRKSRSQKLSQQNQNLDAKNSAWITDDDYIDDEDTTVDTDNNNATSAYDNSPDTNYIDATVSEGTDKSSEVKQQENVEDNLFSDDELEDNADVRRGSQTPQNSNVDHEPVFSSDKPADGVSSPQNGNYQLNQTKEFNNTRNIDIPESHSAYHNRYQQTQNLNLGSDDPLYGQGLANRIWAPTSDKPKDRSKRMRKTNVVYEGDVGKFRKIFFGDILTYICYLICIAVIVYGVWQLASYLGEREEAQEVYNGVVSEFVESEPISTEEMDPDTSAWPPIVDFAALKSTNPDVSGWIRIPGTTVDYPIMTNFESEYYLHRNLYQNYSVAGSIFADSGNDADFSNEKHLVIYGHHMNVATMFHDVANYSNTTYFENHRVIYIETPETTYVLRAIGLRNVEPTEVAVRETEFSSEEEFQTYVDEQLSACSIVYDDYDRATIDKLVTLITCSDGGEARQVLHCVVEQEYPTSMVPNVIERALIDNGWSKNDEGTWTKSSTISSLSSTPNGDVVNN